MKTIATEATERSIPAEDALRLVIDTTPALIHTGRPDGYLDYFNQSLVLVPGSVLGRGMRLAVDRCSSPRRCGRIAAEVARSFGEWRTLRGRGARSPCRWRISVVAPPKSAAARQGAILKWYGSSVDIEEQRRSQERVLKLFEIVKADSIH
jgi:hypothetical protein